MQRQLTHRALRHHNLDARVSDFLEHLFELDFFATREVLQLLRIVQ